MYISTDRPENIFWSIDSNPSSDAAFVTSSTFLSDGKISTPTRISWDTNVAPATTDYVLLHGTFDAVTIRANTMGVFAILMPKTPYAIPAGVFIEATISGTDSTGRTVLLDDGSVALVIIISAGGSPITPSAFSVLVYNDKNGSTWATPGQLFDIGEIWFGSLQEFKNTTDPKRKLVDLVTNRRSHNNTNQPLMGGNPYYQWTYGLTPMSNASAYSSSTIPTYSQVEYALSQAKAALIIGRIHVSGSATTIDQASINYSTAFGRPANDCMRELQAHKDAPLWTAGLTFETQPA